MNIRPISTDDYCFLEEFLYQAIYVSSDSVLPPKAIIYTPEIYIYVKDFGKQKGDYAVIAEEGNDIVGMAWTRIIPAYGYIDSDTPELAISLLSEYRGKGAGTRLMETLHDILRENGYRYTSLSVQKDNPAVRFYLRLGYEILEERLDFVGHSDYIMKYDLYNERKC